MQSSFDEISPLALGHPHRRWIVGCERGFACQRRDRPESRRGITAGACDGVRETRAQCCDVGVDCVAVIATRLRPATSRAIASFARWATGRGSSRR
jgi:hypothetical protein